MQTVKTFRLDPKLAQIIQKLANKSERSWNAQAVYLLKTHPEVQKLLNSEEYT